jgi:hypothetical protein
MNKDFHRNLSITDDFNCSMAVLNYSGLALASQGDYDEDKYDDDESIGDNNVDKRAAYIYYKPLNEYKTDL